VKVTASDGHGASVSTSSFNWKVTALSLTNPGTQHNAVGDKVSLSTIVASGVPSGDTPTYSATGLSSIGLSINASTGVISGTVTGAAKSYSVTVSVRDGAGASTSVSFTWTITALSVTNPGTQSAAIGASVSLQILASGLPVGDSWTYAASGLPSWLGINSTTGLITGTVSGPITSYSITITVSDGDGATASVTFTFKVT